MSTVTGALKWSSGLSPHPNGGSFEILDDNGTGNTLIRWGNVGFPEFAAAGVGYCRLSGASGDRSVYFIIHFRSRVIRPRARLSPRILQGGSIRRIIHSLPDGVLFEGGVE
jgi:hypothetical protein